MKVLHVIPSLSQVHGGPTRALALMEGALAARGVDVETVTTDDDGPGRRLARPAGELVVEGAARRRYFPKVCDFYKPSPSLASWLDRHVADYDLVHIHALFSFAPWAAARAARRHGVPYVLRPLGTLDAWGRTRRRPRLKALSLRCIEAPMLRHAAAVHFTSEAEAAQARALGIAWREAVVPLGVDLPANPPPPSPSPSPEPDSVLFLSRLDPKKNVESLLRAIALLAPSMPRLRLRIAGSGEGAYSQALTAQAQALGIADRVEWLGHVTGEAKAAAFSRASVFVLPSFTENFGIAAAEALAAGVPCVLSTDVALASQVAAAGAGVNVAPEASAIAQALQRIIRAPRERAEMARRAQHLARTELSAQVMGERLERLYREILE